MQSLPPIYGTFGNGSSTQTAGTAITSIIKPNNEVTLLYGLGSKGSGSLFGRGWVTNSTPRAHLTSLVYTTAGTAHTVSVLRPLNWTYTTASSAVNVNTLTLAYDPGLYSTSYAYPLPTGTTFPGNVADNAIANTDYVAFQLADGTWFSSKVTSFSGSTLTLVTTLPNPTGAFASGLVLVNTPVFFFGQASDTIPALGMTQWQTTTIASTNRQQLIPDALVGGLATIFVGDPMLILSNNITAAGSLDGASGYYGKY